MMIPRVPAPPDNEQPPSWRDFVSMGLVPVAVVGVGLLVDWLIT
jgi:hypothetical protein